VDWRAARVDGRAARVHVCRVTATMVLLRRFRVWRTPQAQEREFGDANREYGLENRDTGRCLCLDRTGRATEVGPVECERKKDGWVKHRDVYGCLGLLPIPCKRAGEAHSVTFACVVTECKSEGSIPGGEIFHISAVGEAPPAAQICMLRPHRVETPVALGFLFLLYLGPAQAHPSASPPGLHLLPGSVQNAHAPQPRSCSLWRLAAPRLTAAIAEFLALSTDGYKPLPFYISHLKKLFSSGRFFFCVDTSQGGGSHVVLSAYNITRNIQDHPPPPPPHPPPPPQPPPPIFFL